MNLKRTIATVFLLAFFSMPAQAKSYLITARQIDPGGVRSSIICDMIKPCASAIKFSAQNSASEDHIGMLVSIDDHLIKIQFYYKGEFLDTTSIAKKTLDIISPEKPETYKTGLYWPNPLALTDHRRSLVLRFSNTKLGDVEVKVDPVP